MNNESMDAISFIDDSYFNYAMYVINDRSTPSLADGLKPVHRRLVYAMHQLKLTPNEKYKKSARTVGDTLGKYHPHGDTACYEAMVLMAQPFSTLYPLVDGQGNWGSLDEPQSFAAMRYTEAKLTAYAQLLLDELSLNTVEFADNFDGSLKEPIVLPAQVPNVLINGGSGIAVGMASDIVPHNLKETVEQCIRYLQNPSITPEALLQTAMGPDFPTGGVIVSSRESLLNAYRTGRGSVTLRAGYHVEGNEIIIDSIPYRTAVSKILEQVANQIDTKQIPGLVSIRDDTDKDNPLRIALIMRSARIDADEMMAHLFATTDLQTTVKINFNLINLQGKADTLSYYQIIRQWCQFRQETFERKKRHRLTQIEKRLYILSGLLIAYLNIDEVIRIIREEDDPKQVLCTQFNLSEIQAQAILDIRLRQLAKLEEAQLRKEQAELEKEADALRLLLGSDRRIKTAIIKEMEAVVKRFEKPRLSKIEHDAFPAKKFVEKPQAAQPVTLVISEQNWVRVAAGHEVDVTTLPYKTGDKARFVIKTDSATPAILLDTQGRFYALEPAVMPQGKSASEPLSKHLTLPAGADVFWADAYQEDAMIFLCSTLGNAFITPMNALNTKFKKGKEVWRFAKGDTPAFAGTLSTHTHVVAASSDDYLVAVSLDEINHSMKSQGIRLVSLPGDLTVSGVALANIDSPATIYLKDGVATIAKLADYVCSRARRGRKFKLRNGKIS